MLEQLEKLWKLYEGKREEGTYVNRYRKRRWRVSELESKFSFDGHSLSGECSGN